MSCTSDYVLYFKMSCTKQTIIFISMRRSENLRRTYFIEKDMKVKIDVHRNVHSARRTSVVYYSRKTKIGKSSRDRKFSPLNGLIKNKNSRY